MSGQGFFTRDSTLSEDHPTPTEKRWDLHALADRLLAVLPYTIILLALSARLVPGPRTIDDSYITYRYARNILAGNGFVYNPGERVLGTTTPLYTLLLATMGVITGGAQAPFPQIAMGVNALADALTCVLLLHLGRLLGSRLAGIGAALAWAIAPYSVTFAVGGLETSLYILLLTATAVGYLEKRYSLASVTAALAILTRPDALLLVAPLALDRLFNIWRAPVSRPPSSAPSPPPPVSDLRSFLTTQLLPFTLPLLAWYSFATLYFGTPIPHSVAAKSLAYKLDATEGLIRLLQHYTTPFMEHLTLSTRWVAVGLVLYPFLYLLGARQAFSRTRRAWPLLLFPWLYFAAFAIANPLIFRWYLTPPLPLYILVILVGAHKLIRDIASRLNRSNELRAGLILKSLPVLILVILPFLSMSRDWTLQPDHGLTAPAPGMAWYKLELLYREAAQILELQIGSQDVLAAGDVGVLGYFTGARILDTVGLNSAQTLDYYPIDPSYYVTNYAIPPDLILDHLPDYIVILEVYGRQGLLKDPRFWQAYRQIQKLPTAIYGSDGMLLFARNPG